MEYDLRTPTTTTEAIEIFDSALRVIYGQIEYYRGARKKAWNGDFVTHMEKEARGAIEFLRAEHR